MTWVNSIAYITDISHRGKQHQQLPLNARSKSPMSLRADDDLLLRKDDFLGLRQADEFVGPLPPTNNVPVKFQLRE
jgi:hypothetical protein